jgi:hypothetical protein
MEPHVLSRVSQVAEPERVVEQYADLFVQHWDTFSRQRDGISALGNTSAREKNGQKR